MTTVGGYSREYDVQDDPQRKTAVVLNPYLLTLALPGTQGPPLVAGDIASLLPEDIDPDGAHAAAEKADTLTVTVLDTDGSTPLEGASVTVTSPLGVTSGVTDESGQVEFEGLPVLTDAASVVVLASSGAKQESKGIALTTSANALTLVPAEMAGSLVVTVLGKGEGNPPEVGATVTVTPPTPWAELTGTTGAGGTKTFAAGTLPAAACVISAVNVGGDHASASKTLAKTANTQSLTLQAGD